jgi:hypothetical protein
LLGALSLSGKVKPLFLKAMPVSFSLGTPLWQKLHGRPICLAKLGLASALGMRSINAKAKGVAAKALRSAMDFSLRRASLAEQRASTIFPASAQIWVDVDRGSNLQLA